ncbi:MAG: acetate--CoA ligase family protein [Phycisphaerales bacterium JB039]
MTGDLLGGPASGRGEPGAGAGMPPGAQPEALDRLLRGVGDSDRSQLHEHEVYRILDLAGGIAPPRHRFVGAGESISAETLAAFAGDRIVVKIVSPGVVHKSDDGGVVFCAREPAIVQQALARLIGGRRSAGAEPHGALLVEFIESEARGLGVELFVGIPSTRAFGPVIAAGFGGTETEYLAGVMRRGEAIATGIATETEPEAFLELFRATAAYDLISGGVRGRRRLVGDDELIRCFGVFIWLARRLCVDRGPDAPGLASLEVNPFALVGQRMVPLDGCGRLGSCPRRPAARPLDNVQRMLEPRSMAVMGVSARSQNFGRIILQNTLRRGFDPARLYIVKPAQKQIDGVRCVATIEQLPEPVDLLVIATSADQLPAIIGESVESGKVRSAIVIPGGVGETQGSADLFSGLRSAIVAGRTSPGGGLVVLGPNCLGVQSRAGRHDTFFIPQNKLSPAPEGPGRRLALISQSGAFIVSCVSGNRHLDPALSISVGNQVDLTVGDLVAAAGARDDIRSIGVYVEGFSDLDGLDTLRAVRALSEAGKTVVLYKAGRTEQGRDAAAGHTASVAGDYEVCAAGARAAGALVADSFAQFEQLVELAALLEDRTVRGARLGAITNAGFEAVGIADGLHGAERAVAMPALPEATVATLGSALAAHGLGGLINLRNPLDLTPMAREAAYEAAARALLECEQLDALLLSSVPLTPALATTAEEIEGRESLAEVLQRLRRDFDKPIAAVIDGGPQYHALIDRIRAGGTPVFARADEAMRSFGRYLCHRAGLRARPTGSRARSGSP